VLPTQTDHDGVVAKQPFTVSVKPNADKAINLGKYKQVLVFGDSNMQAFSIPITRLCRPKEEEQVDDKCNMKYGLNVNAQLNRNHLKKRFRPGIRKMVQATIQEGKKLEDKWRWWSGLMSGI
jgi:hypothetical protein